MHRSRLIAAFCLSLIAGPLFGQTGCGGDFDGFVDGLRTEALSKGFDKAAVTAFFAHARQDGSVLKLDRGQAVFKQSFLDFLANKVSTGRLKTGRAKIAQHQKTFARIDAKYGIPAGVLAAYWGLETDFGTFQGKTPSLNALITLAHDCRRPTLFRPQIFAALELSQRGGFDPVRSVGAWAGEIGQFQMLPADVLKNGTDGDGDGKVDVRNSEDDALMSAAKMLSGFGWRAGEPWLQEIVVPDNLDWATTGLNHSRAVSDWQGMGVRARKGDLPSGLQGSVLLPMGRFGPAFMAYPNYRIYFNWNKSFVYATTSAYFATRLDGAPAIDPRQPEAGLTVSQMKKLQERLVARGHDVGKIDGILGELTREAVQAEQVRLGLPADAWPTRALADAL